MGIANALNRPFDLLILDEATNALDRETEENFFDRLVETYYDKTIIYVSHEQALRKYAKKQSMQNLDVYYETITKFYSCFKECYCF